MGDKDRDSAQAQGRPRTGGLASTYLCPHCGKEHPLFIARCPTDGMPVDGAFRMSGKVLEGKYEVGRAIGRGGMGVVYEGRHRTTGRRIALKFLLAEVKSTAQMLERFQNEARMAASVGHRNIVDVLDLSETPDGISFIVMEFLDGKDLGEILRSAPRLSVSVAVEFTVQILSALRAVHDQGIIHRDLKPENIIVLREADQSLSVKLLDFGLSRLMERDKEVSITRTGVVFGTPAYMAPEQARGKREIDRRADLYSMGVILYRMLAGSLPFEATDYNNMIIAITTEDPIPVTEHGASIPPGLAEIVMRAIRRAPDERFSSATEFFEAVRPFRGWTQAPAAPIRPSTPTPKPILDWGPGKKPPSTYSLGRGQTRNLVDVVGPSRIFQVVKANPEEIASALSEPPKPIARIVSPDEATASRVYSIVGRDKPIVDVLGSGKRGSDSAEIRLREAMRRAASPKPPPTPFPAVVVEEAPLQIPADVPAAPPPPVRVRPARGRIGITLLVAGVVVIAVLLLGMGFLYVQARSLARTAGSAAPPTLPTAREEPAASEAVTITLDGLPDGARVYVDGVLHAERPVAVIARPDPLDLRITAPGYDDWQQVVAVYSSTTLRVSMAPTAEETAPRETGTKTGKKPPDEPEEKGTRIDTTYPQTP